MSRKNENMLPISVPCSRSTAARNVDPVKVLSRVETIATPSAAHTPLPHEARPAKPAAAMVCARETHGRES